MAGFVQANRRLGLAVTEIDCAGWSVGDIFRCMWSTDITDSDLITEEKADFLLSEAKEQLAATIEDAEALTKPASIYREDC